MRRISVEVGSGTARFRVSMQAKTIERALEIAHRQNSGKEYKVIFPLDPQAFSVREESVASRSSTWRIPLRASARLTTATTTMRPTPSSGRSGACWLPNPRRATPKTYQPA